MSGKRARQQRLTGPRGVVQEEYDVGASPGLTINTPEAIAAMRQLTHDGIIADAGHRRRSAVRWVHYYGTEAAEVYETMIAESETPADPDHVRQYREFIATYGEDTVLVVAMVDVVPLAGRRFHGPA